MELSWFRFVSENFHLTIWLMKRRCRCKKTQENCTQCNCITAIYLIITYHKQTSTLLCRYPELLCIYLFFFSFEAHSHTKRVAWISCNFLMELLCYGGRCSSLYWCCWLRKTCNHVCIHVGIRETERYPATNNILWSLMFICT